MCIKLILQYHILRRSCGTSALCRNVLGMVTLTAHQKRSIRREMGVRGGTAEFDDCGDYIAVQLIAPEGTEWEPGLTTFCFPTNNYESFGELSEDIIERLPA